AGAALGGAVVGVEHAADVEREAAAADAGVEVVAEALEERDALVEERAPAGGEPFPLARRGGAFLGEGGERGADVVEGEADTLRGLDEGEAAEDVATVAALVAGVAGGGDQTAVLVEAQRRGGEAGARGGLADREEVVCH